MKYELTCNIVQNLLPNYIEKLTNEDTNTALEEHLDGCENCKTVYEQMDSDIEKPIKVPVIKLNFLKKVKRTKLFAALLSVILSLIFSYLIYSSEFKYTMDKSDLSGAITAFLSPFKNSVDAYVLETKEIDGVLFASFKDQSDETVYGIAKFYKGFNQKYRIVQSENKHSHYSSFVQYYSVEVKDKQYTAISGYNLTNETNYYGLNYVNYSSTGNSADDRVIEPVKFEVKNQQFLEVYESKELENLLKIPVGNNFFDYYLTTTSLYDANGIEITENYRILDDQTSDVSSATGKAELFVLYIYILIVIGLGIIFARYFITK
jgi:hypothetical protein